MCTRQAKRLFLINKTLTFDQGNRSEHVIEQGCLMVCTLILIYAPIRLP